MRLFFIFYTFLKGETACPACTVIQGTLHPDNHRDKKSTVCTKAGRMARLIFILSIYFEKSGL
ncbi:hypothetical protein D1164_21720 [Mariniphaga sediminis]|uniref:Uncharacterized protein n=1 Tax=Mariniphaga sediminis TaxID=1628158 RepID=A0A399CXC9_9BACT|nr:hypothetical protein D1164_21720 [Mariniphaga sediminis]